MATFFIQDGSSQYFLVGTERSLYCGYLTHLLAEPPLDKEINPLLSSRLVLVDSLYFEQCPIHLICWHPTVSKCFIVLTSDHLRCYSVASVLQWSLALPFHRASFSAWQTSKLPVAWSWHNDNLYWVMKSGELYCLSPVLPLAGGKSDSRTTLNEAVGDLQGPAIILQEEGIQNEEISDLVCIESSKNPLILMATEQGQIKIYLQEQLNDSKAAFTVTLIGQFQVTSSAVKFIKNKNNLYCYSSEKCMEIRINADLQCSLHLLIEDANIARMVTLNDQLFLQDKSTLDWMKWTETDENINIQSPSFALDPIGSLNQDAALQFMIEQTKQLRQDKIVSLADLARSNEKQLQSAEEQSRQQAQEWDHIIHALAQCTLQNNQLQSRIKQLDGRARQQMKRIDRVMELAQWRLLAREKDSEKVPILLKNALTLKEKGEAFLSLVDSTVESVKLQKLSL